MNISRELEKHHYFFRAFWDVGCERFTEDKNISTACIRFDITSGEQIAFLLNRTYWDSLNEHTKLFVVCHEMLHIVLQHGKRFAQYFNTPYTRLINIATDVVINEMLITHFGFDRTLLDKELSEKGAWFDTIFKDRPDVKRYQSSEYYFEKLMERKDDYVKIVYYSIDTHELVDGGGTPIEDDPDVQEIIRDSGILDKIDSRLIQKMQSDLPLEVKNKYKQRLIKRTYKDKWESIIKKWERWVLQDDYHLGENWFKPNSRYINLYDPRMKMPSENYIYAEHIILKKIDVFFFLDVSGSCAHLADRFFKAAKSLNPKYFNIRLLNFDTSVIDISKSDTMQGGGGTSFRVIEDYVQMCVKNEGIKYPKKIWVVTDGMGDAISPEKPENYSWFLTEYHDKSLIPPASKCYMLNEFE